MSSFQELRSLALDARKLNSNERQERYIKARDEAFEVLTDGIMEKIQNAAKKGFFRFPIYRWTNQSRQKSDEATEEEKETTDETQMIFGKDADGKNGLHIMALIQPTGIPYRMTLGAKLHAFFNSKPEGEVEASEDQAREPVDDQLRVFFQRRPENPRQCAIYVSWEKQVPDFRRPVISTPRLNQPRVAPSVQAQDQTTLQRPQQRPPRPQTTIGVVRPDAEAAVEAQSRPYVRGAPSVRGGAMRGRGGRGRGGGFGVPRT